MKTPPVKRRQEGVALLEALIAVLILAIGLIGTVGLQARSYAALSDAGLRAEATIAVNELLGIMNSDLEHAADYAVAAGEEPGERLQAWHEAVSARLPGATITVGVIEPTSAAPRTTVSVRIGWRRQDNDSDNTHSVTAYLAETK
jgi:type IV pilus assembly protein PilV